MMFLLPVHVHVQCEASTADSDIVLRWHFATINVKLKMNCRTESIFFVQHGGSRVENH